MLSGVSVGVDCTVDLVERVGILDGGSFCSCSDVGFGVWESCGDRQGSVTLLHIVLFVCGRCRDV